MTLTPFVKILTSLRPAAIASLRGNGRNPVRGSAAFYRTYMGGILIQVEVIHLPDSSSPDDSSFFGMHIHEKGDCTPPFDQTGAHYNPGNREHPFHAGDLPPLLSNNGYAWTAFYDARISVSDIIGKSLIIHEGLDDFTTQPSGRSGAKIACGVIEAFM